MFFTYIYFVRFIGTPQQYGLLFGTSSNPIIESQLQSSSLQSHLYCTGLSSASHPQLLHIFITPPGLFITYSSFSYIIC